MADDTTPKVNPKALYDSMESVCDEYMKRLVTDHKHKYIKASARYNKRRKCRH
jgi:hypothetical protein